VKTLKVDLAERQYPVFVGQGLLSVSGSILKKLGFRSPPIVVSNRTVLNLHGPVLFASLRKSFGQLSAITIGDGERFKEHSTLLRIYDGMFRNRANRKSWVLAFGGGVIGDIAGFAAATFMRGIPYVMIPTTLLAQVDSSVGGKVAINLPQGKNLVGAFHQPAAVLSDTQALATLPDRELASGLYEVVKCGAIRSEPLLRYLEAHVREIMARRPSTLAHVVVEAVAIKADVVAHDEREDGLRMILNYGHTIGHALEAATAYARFKHGEAIAWGMIAAAGYGRELGMLRPEEASRLVALVHQIGPLPTLGGIRLSDLWGALLRDKKFPTGGVRMILLPRLGEAQIHTGIDSYRNRCAGLKAVSEAILLGGREARILNSNYGLFGCEHAGTE
jgi:3-dehydroquinate synthase